MKRNSLIFIFFSLLISALSHAQLEGSPEWTKSMVMYEVNVRHYTEEGTFKAFEKHLPRLKALGVNTLWFMPIQPVGKKNSKGELGSPYAIQNYEKINPRFGSMADFKALVKKAHALNMKVLIEWVANHSAWDNVLTQSHPEWYLRDGSGNFVPPKPEWEDVIEFDYGSKALTEYMQAQIIRWVKETNIDGFRFDVAGMMPNEFWRSLKPKLDAIKPLYVFTDGYEIELMEDSLDLVYSYDFLDVMENVAGGKNSVKAIYDYLENESSHYGEHKNRLYFTSGHIANSFQGTVFERFGDAAEPMAVLTATLPGVPLLYSGQEAGLNKRLNFFDKDLITWQHHKFSPLYSRLFSLKQNPAAWAGNAAGNPIWLNSSKNPNVFSMLRTAKKTDDKILILINFSKNQEKINLSNAIAFDNYRDAFDESFVAVTNETSFELAPWSYRVLVKSSNHLSQIN